MIGERARQRDALLHTAGQFLWVEILKALEADHLEQCAGLRLGLHMFHALLARAVHDIAEYTLPGEQRELLEHRPAIRTRSCDHLALHSRDATGRLHEAAD